MPSFIAKLGVVRMSAVKINVEADRSPAPFHVFMADAPPTSRLREAITEHTRTPEPACVGPLLEQARLAPAVAERVQRTAVALVTALRAKGASGTVEGLVREYDLSSGEGVALMCLAEALLRIPDASTRDALIRDKIAGGDWRGHLGHSPSLFVNAATWGLVVTGRLTGNLTGNLTGAVHEAGLGAALSRLIARGGEPVIRKSVALAMRMMGEQFVTGQTIAEALANSRRLEARGFRYSYDMLGEAAMTAHDAARYHGEYEAAIHAIGRAAAGRGPYEAPGISIKLSALHPRYVRSQRDRVMTELLARLRALATLARGYDIGLNIDAEEADRLDLSMDLLEALCLDPGLAGWDGIGFVVQAYQKRAPFVIDWLVDLARRSGHRLMVRLVKGAYWDSEIKRAQVDGLADFPVFTRKPHTDVSWLACARKLLDATAHVFPQFATHNAYSVAAILGMAGPEFRLGDYEFQCLHGMGETLYDEVVGEAKLGRPCRIYAPVGTHETLLAYLVRRLLENGANSSFVNRIHDPAVPASELVADPVATVAASLPIGAPNPRISGPRDLFAPARVNSAGLDLSDERTLAMLAATLPAGVGQPRHEAPSGLTSGAGGLAVRAIRNPADHRDIVGHIAEASPELVDRALAIATASAPDWAARSPAERAACLLRAADLIEGRMPALLGLIVREAGKSLANAVAEVREAVDFLRYYATEAQARLTGCDVAPLGAVTCISPWNFPLAIFVGQVAAALAAGNAVLAKPAEETPLIAARAVAILHEAGVPADALHFLPGQGSVGARLVADPRTRAVVFTGSNEVARLIQRQLATRLNPDGGPVPLIAETGGVNALVVDSSALVEQVVGDVLASAFDSAGQRCSALRLLCLQDEIADRTLAMLRGALAELAIGNPDRLATDIGPVVSEPARQVIEAHLSTMAEAGHAVHRLQLPERCRDGTFVAPAIVELPEVAALIREVFGPVLHIVRFRAAELDAVVDAINATGFALTFGLHTRLDETAARVVARSSAGNVYVNRNVIGAVVGVQPFGGHALSGTGPKAGGPLYLRRLLARPPAATGLMPGPAPAAARAWASWLADADADAGAAAEFATLLPNAPSTADRELAGPVGERNMYRTEPCGSVLCVATARADLLRQVGAALATGNRALLQTGRRALLANLPATLADWVVETGERSEPAVVLFAGDADDLLACDQALAARDGAIVPTHVARAGGDYPMEWLVRERTVSTNTTAAGGNAHLMTIG